MGWWPTIGVFGFPVGVLTNDPAKTWHPFHET